MSRLTMAKRLLIEMKGSKAFDLFVQIAMYQDQPEGQLCGWQGIQHSLSAYGGGPLAFA